MEISRKVEPSLKLITKGCCFLCLQNENIQTEEFDGNQVLQTTSVRQLLHHLQIPTAQSLNAESLVGKDFKNEDVQVDLCENCGEMISRFSVLFQNLEKIQLEMNYFLEKIHKCISQSAKAPDLVQNYSKRMTSDIEALSQLAFVDNLRKQVAKESLKKMNVPRLQLILSKANMKPIKTEISDETCEANDVDFTGNCFADNISPPPSPNSTVNNEEDLKPIVSNFASASTLKEILSPLLPNSSQQQPEKRKGSKYLTRNPSTGIYECKKCDKKSKHRQTILLHFKSDHLKMRYKCDICNVSEFTQLSNLNFHKKTCPEKLLQGLAIEKERKNFQFICKECGKRYRTNKNLLTHRLQVHVNPDRYPCDLCDKKFKALYQLKIHQNAVHFGKKFSCGICSKSFTCKFKMRIHERKCTQKLSLKEETQEKVIKTDHE